MDSDTKTIEVQVNLLNEGTDVSRPTLALDLGEGLFKLLPTPDYDPEDEEWEFVPGTTVRSEPRTDDRGEYLLAVRP
jgi:hypothetical protein